jgi:hypothetical protein
MKTNCIIPWDPENQIYKTTCTIEKPIVKNLIEQKFLVHARDFEELKSLFVADIFVKPCDIQLLKVKVKVITKQPIPFKWMYNRASYEANKSLMPEDILSRDFNRNIEFVLRLGPEFFSLEKKKKILITI